VVTVTTEQPSSTLPATTAEVLTSTSAPGMIQYTRDHLGTTV